MNKDALDLIGNTKNEILEHVGEGNNFFQSDTWMYILKKNRFGFNITMYFYFNSGVVESIKITRTFKINKTIE